MRRAQRLWAPLISGAWLIGLIPAALSTTPTAVCLAAAVLAWSITVARRPREPIWLIATVTASSVAIIWLTDGGIGSGSTPVAAAWFDAAAVTAGLGMARLRRAVLMVAAIGAVALVAWTLVAVTGPLDGGWRTALAWPTATWGGGLAVALAVAVIQRGAFRLDQVRGLADSAATDEDIAMAARERLARFARLLHDTVINTLGAVGQGLPGASRQQLADRCRSDLARLDAADPDAPDDLVAALRGRARALGLQLDVAGDTAPLADLPAPTLSALSVALGEGLLNTLKHSGADRAILRITPNVRGLRVTLADTGSGWDGGFPATGGIAESIIARCREVGITVTIETAPGRGTAVVLQVPRPAPRQVRVAGLIRTEAVALGMVGCGAIAADVGIRTGLTVGLYPALPGLAAYAVLLGALLLAWRAVLRPRGPLTYAAWAALSLALALIIPLLPDAAIGPLSWGWWATIATLPLFGALLLLGAPPLVLALAYAIQTMTRVIHNEAHPTDIVFPQVISVAFAAVLLWAARERIYSMVLRSDESVATLADRRRRTLSTLGGQREGARQLQVILEPARDMLAWLADGTADSDDPAVRQWCAREAHYLRSVSLLGPFLADADVGLVRLLSAAHADGVPVRVNIDAEVVLPPQPMRERLSALLGGAAVDLTDRGSVSLTMLHSSDGHSATLVGEGRPWSLPSSEVRLAREAGLEVDNNSADGSALLEIRWPAPQS